ncbi:AzlC family ABC transporter permease [Nitratidesulfovibrio liaohensis]|uniref:AzlC family ABC transporter permease n=1 Tax=Nitratidesulfovibrio liaohensis TaxID=2604158 RepID=A0ABY9QY52_9BACT|nr:AzlC family ABC transporter permease [Nitratidesulfovibrio liaohensis]WMW64466.1 AzlC family ABC transporter permease [Nitratidesulfovibrio liaohensis]
MDTASSPGTPHAPTSYHSGAIAPASRLAAVLSGMRQALPIVLGYVPVAFAFGVLARKTGIPASGAVCMSLMVFAGSAQLISVSLLAGGASPATVVLTTFVVNLRHLLMSAALAPALRRWPRALQALFAFQLTDETFALHVSRLPSAPGDARPEPPRAETLALNMTAQSAWVMGTIIGVFGSELVADVRPLGLDYALPAMFIALLLPYCRKARRFALAAVLAGGLSVLLALAGAGQWNVIIATVCAATLCTLLPARADAAQHAARNTACADASAEPDGPGEADGLNGLAGLPGLAEPDGAGRAPTL